MDDLDDHSLILMEALQCLDLLPSAHKAAEQALKRVLRLIESTKEEIRCPKDKPIEGKRPRRETDESIVSHRAFERLRGRCDAAVAIGKIQELVKTTEDDKKEDDAAPRRSVVRRNLGFIAAHGDEFADALDSPYVLDALAPDIPLGEASDDSDLHSLVPRLRQITVAAKEALERREPLITKKGLAYGDPYYKDVGGSGNVLSVDQFPLKQRFVDRCLDLFGQYRPGVATETPGGPFARFVGATWDMATGKPEELRKAIKETFRAIRSGSPKSIAARLNLPEGTLPPRKTRR